MRNRFGAELLAALMLVALAGCASVPREAPALTAAALEAFQLSGRINVRVEQDAFPGRVRWSHAPGRDELWFYSPVGTAIAHLVQDDQGAVLVDAQGREHRAADLRALTVEVLGWDLPLEGLPYWVRGLPWPAAGTADEQRDEHGRLRELGQAGWNVSYLAWAAGGADALPAKLDLQGERLRLRLVIDRWSADVAP